MSPAGIGSAPTLPPGFGQLAGLPFGTGQNPQIPTPVTPQALETSLTNQQPQAGAVSDLVKVQFGPIDKQLIGQLLASVAGQDSGLVGVPSTYASQRLTQLGLPQHFTDWTTDQWTNAIANLQATQAPSIVF